MPGLDRDIRFLVCEGKCNPDIRDYDQMVNTRVQRGISIRFLVERGRELRHTPHEAIRSPVTKSASEMWVPTQGWFKRYRCVVCGSTRRY